MMLVSLVAVKPFCMFEAVGADRQLRTSRSTRWLEKVDRADIRDPTCRLSMQCMPTNPADVCLGVFQDMYVRGGEGGVIVSWRRIAWTASVVVVVLRNADGPHGVDGRMCSPWGSGET